MFQGWTEGGRASCPVPATSLGHSVGPDAIPPTQRRSHALGLENEKLANRSPDVKKAGSSQNSAWHLGHIQNYPTSA